MCDFQNCWIIPDLSNTACDLRRGHHIAAVCQQLDKICTKVLILFLLVKHREDGGYTDYNV